MNGSEVYGRRCGVRGRGGKGDGLAERQPPSTGPNRTDSGHTSSLLPPSSSPSPPLPTPPNPTPPPSLRPDMISLGYNPSWDMREGGGRGLSRSRIIEMIKTTGNEKSHTHTSGIVEGGYGSV